MKCEGTVISVDGAKAKVTVTTTSECMGCSSKSHCHSGLTGSREITVINECGAKVSDNIIFETTAGKFIVSAALIWILPLISMIIGYIVGERFADGFWPIGAAFVFLVLAFAFLKVLDKAISGGRTFYPVIMRVIYSSGKENNV